MTEQEIQIARFVLDALNTAGAIGILTFLVVAFYTGKIIPKQVVDDLIVSLSAELLKGIDERIEKMRKNGW